MLNYTENYKFVKPDESEFYDINVPNGNMDKVDAELKKLDDEKAPSGHGLGKSGNVAGSIPLKEVMHRGCGFYQVGHSEDSPLPSGEWMGLIQMVRNPNENAENGTQLVFYDFSTSNPRMWMRNLINGSTSPWVEMIHTGNATNLLPFVRIATGSYVGTGVNKASEPIVLNSDFKPKVLCINGTITIPYGATTVTFNATNGTKGRINLTWGSSSVSFYFDNSSGYEFRLNTEGNAYFYALIG